MKRIDQRTCGIPVQIGAPVTDTASFSCEIPANRQSVPGDEERIGCHRLLQHGELQNFSAQFARFRFVT